MQVTLPRTPRAAAPASPPPPAAAPAATLAELFAQQHATDAGLTEAEAARRRAAAGPNEAAPAAQHVLLRQMIATAANPLNVILLLAAGVSGLLGEPFNAGLIGVMVLLSIGLNFVQTYRSQQAADRLRSQVAPQATVLRDGTWADRPRRDVVPGDVIRLGAGDLVPADARLITARDLHVQQAALTGESLPAEKEVVTGAEAPDPARCLGTVFLGTSIVSGTATALVVATGRGTAFGDIAARLATRAPETEFERGTRRFGLFIMRTVTFLVLFVFLVSAALKHDPFESLLFAVALAVGLTPEFLPMITAVTLSRGAVHMARRQVIVKNLAAIQNFGSIDMSVQRQDRHDHRGRDGAAGPRRPAGHARRAGLPARLPEQLLRHGRARRRRPGDPASLAARPAGHGDPAP